MIANILHELRNTSKPSEKIGIINKYDALFSEHPVSLRKLLKLSYDPFVHFNVKLSPKETPPFGDNTIVDLYEDVIKALEFCESSFSPKQNREVLMPIFAQLKAADQELLFCIINKNWKAGISGKTILKAIPNLFKLFEVQLANTYNPEKHNVIGRSWTYKMDGLRCIALRVDGDWKFYSRQGKEFLTVDHLKPFLELLYERDGQHPTFWDGELYKHGMKFEDIQGLVTGFTKGTAEEIDYYTFALGSADAFLRQNNEGIMSVPVKYIENRIDAAYEGEYQFSLKFVKGGGIESEEDVEKAMEKAFSLGYEGIMMRDPDIEYDFKRSNALLKCKKLEDEGEIISDCTVLGIEKDDFPVIEDGKMKTEHLLVRLIVQQEDEIECKVGSGFDLDFRRKYTEEPEAILGKKVEVLHQGWGKKGRMRFPRLVKVREDL